MSTPSWDDLTALNIAASARDLSGRLHVVGDTDTGRVDDEFVFWHKATDRWWVERNGDVVYASATTAEDVPVARIDGQMVYQRRNNRIRTGRKFTPDDLFGPRSMVVRRSRGSRPLHKPELIEVDGRSCWAVTVDSPDGTHHRLAFDDATGVIVDMSSPDYPANSLSLSQLREHTELPPAQVTWDGPAIETHELNTIGMSW